MYQKNISHHTRAIDFYTRAIDFYTRAIDFYTRAIHRAIDFDTCAGAGAHICVKLSNKDKLILLNLCPDTCAHILGLLQ